MFKEENLIRKISNNIRPKYRGKLRKGFVILEF